MSGRVLGIMGKNPKLAGGLRVTRVKSVITEKESARN